MMMRRSRVREETPQPTMRVTDGSRDLSIIWRERRQTQHTLVRLPSPPAHTGKRAGEKQV